MLDLTGESADTAGQLEMENVPFELTPKQRHYQEMIQHVNSYMRNQYHAIHHFLWMSGYAGLLGGMPRR